MAQVREVEARSKLRAVYALAMKLQKLAVVALTFTLALTGCTQVKTYASPDQLKNAWVDAGGECDDATNVDETLLGDGANAIMCMPDVTMLIVFDSQEQLNSYLAATIKDDVAGVSGDRWVAMIDNPDEYASKLGGKVQKS
jgi:hypothetical protein